MNIKTLFIVFLVFSFEILSAQTNVSLQPESDQKSKKPKRSFIALSMCFPTPTGDYKSTDIKNDKALFAKGTFGIALEGAFMFHPNIGIGGIWGGYRSKFNVDKFNESILKQFHLTGSTSIKSTAESHSVGIFMVGPNLSIPLKGISLDLKFYVGSLTYIFPEVKTTLISGSNVSTVKFTAENTGKAFGFNPGIAARIKLSKRMLVKLTVDYIEGDTKIKTFSTSTSNGYVNPKKVEETDFTISMVNLGFGLGIQLNKE